MNFLKKHWGKLALLVAVPACFYVGYKVYENGTKNSIIEFYRESLGNDLVYTREFLSEEDHEMFNENLAIHDAWCEIVDQREGGNINE